jgi:hypothetical protein
MHSADDDHVPHQFRTRNDLTETQQTRSIHDENAGKSTKVSVNLPLITIWLQVVSWQTTNEFNG